MHWFQEKQNFCIHSYEEPYKLLQQTLLISLANNSQFCTHITSGMIHFVQMHKLIGVITGSTYCMAIFLLTWLIFVMLRYGIIADVVSDHCFCRQK